MDYAMVDEGLKYVLASGGVLAVLGYFFSLFRNRMSDDSTRSSVINLLKNQIDEANERMKLERQRADQFAAERNDALAEQKAWKANVEHLNKQLQEQSAEIDGLQSKVEEQNDLLRAQGEENQRLREYVHDLLTEINRFVRSHPAVAGDLVLPEYPEKAQ